ncbi:PAS domain-containing protein [Nguyenibacter vanlangensis]|uniref:histidine kinase n=1 Tax=Nguyenibacter vanlangensis TaxID=1216886 RepID=A0ABZ3D891_9PROT
MVGLFSRHAGDPASAGQARGQPGDPQLAAILGFDWAATPAGAVETWPDCLRYAIRLAVASSSPMAVLIGRQGLLVPNRVMCDIVGPDYADALGRPTASVFPQAADFYREAVARTFLGQPSHFQDVRMRMHQDGALVSRWFDIDFTPIFDQDGAVRGALLSGGETTERVRTRLDLQHAKHRLDLALQAGGLVGTWEVDFNTEIVITDERFALLHGVDPAVAARGADRALFMAGIHPDDRERVVSTLSRARERGENYRCEHRVIGGGRTRWVVTSARMLPGPDGRPARCSGVAVDVTQQVETSMALAASERQFRTYTDTLPHIVFGWDADGRNDYCNRRWQDFTGHANAPGEPCPWQDFLHTDDRDRVTAAWRDAVATGQRMDVQGRLRHHSGEYRWGQVIALPIAGEAGAAPRWIGTMTDIHEAKCLETERALVERELDHRIKNLFAIVYALINLTLEDGQDADAFAEKLRARLRALAHTHDFIRARTGNETAQQAGYSLQELLRRILSPYGETAPAGRLTIDGDDAAIDARTATPLALIFHELATNAAKHGALGRPPGRLAITCRRSDARIGILWHEWDELAPPTPADPATGQAAEPGFGSRLLTMVIERQLRGSFRRERMERGIAIRIDLPLASLRAATGAQGDE